MRNSRNYDSNRVETVRRRLSKRYLILFNETFIFTVSNFFVLQVEVKFFAFRNDAKLARLVELYRTFYVHTDIVQFVLINYF